MTVQSRGPEEFIAKWNECIVEKLTGILYGLPNGSALQDAIDTLFDAMDTFNLSKMLTDALSKLQDEGGGEVAQAIITVLTLELEFLCDYGGSESTGLPGYPPTTAHAQAIKAKTILASLLAILPLSPEARRLLHLLIELLDLAS